MLALSGVGSGKLSELDFGAFHGNLQLKEVSLSCFDSVERLESGDDFRGLEGCNHLSITRFGNLAELGPGAFAGLRKLSRLEVTGNVRLKSVQALAFDNTFDRDPRTSVLVDLQNNGFGA